jgi:spermidine synthase
MKRESRRPDANTFAGVFLTSAATLLLQVTFTRVFSVSIWYHFAFLVVSVALFGFGVSGVALSLVASGPRDRALLSWAPAGFGLSTLVAYLGTNALPFSPFNILNDGAQVVYFLLYEVALAIPFFFAGATIALVLRIHSPHAGALYALDLVGAAVGSFLVLASLPALGAPGSVALAAALGFAAAAVLSVRRAPRHVLLAVTLLHVPLLARPSLLPDVRIDRTKPLWVETRERGGRVTFTAWNALSRIDVVEREGVDPMILIDAAARTEIAPPPVDGRSPQIKDISTVAFRIKDRPSVVIIGSGGGMDVQNALALGSRSVDAVEINPTIVDLVTGVYRDHVGDIFSDPRVRLIQDEGRSYMARREDSADIIALTLIDTWAASTSGAYSLTENYLYTVEAFRTFLERLAPGGVLSITRWNFEAPRLTTLARAALESMGLSNAASRVLVVERKIATSVLVKREPFTGEEVRRAEAFVAETDAAVIHDPLAPSMASVHGVILTASRPKDFIESESLALDPVHDNDPFFFQMGRWRNLRLESLRGFSSRNFLHALALPAGQIALVTAFAAGVGLSIVLLAVPILAGKAPRAGRYRWMAYFLGLGLAFIIVEVVLMQRFALFLGHPTYSVTTVLFAILLFSGLGAAWSQARSGTTARVMRPVLVLLPVAVLLMAFAVPPITTALVGLPLGVRLLLAIALIAPVAFLMGVPFPVGIRAAGARDPRLIPWAWAANGCASVVGSVSAVLGAMMTGFTAMLLVAGAVYVVAIGEIVVMRAPVE